ncbi:MAG: glycoside hydrolase family 127 protein [Lewinellaceae bacterium]|nr:glycoside hydrolase family 127 protein [Lewinellaceae bacterium]
MDKTFGWGKLEKAPGHQEIELGLVKLYQLTGEKRYLDLAKFFLDVRGYGDEYSQNHKKVTEQNGSRPCRAPATCIPPWPMWLH